MPPRVLDSSNQEILLILVQWDLIFSSKLQKQYTSRSQPM